MPLIVVVVAGYYGVDLTPLLTGGQSGSQVSQQTRISPNDDEAAKFTAVILGHTEDTWQQIFQQMGKTYQPPKLVMYRGATQTGCGTAQSVMGPFYCPADSTVYIDLSFYDDMKNKLGAGADFAQGYVVAHEVGHHVQKLLEIESQVRQQQQGAPQNTDAGAVSAGRWRIGKVGARTWRRQPAARQAFYQLLTRAHYRTSPIDLRRLLDAPGMSFFIDLTPRARPLGGLPPASG